MNTSMIITDNMGERITIIGGDERFALVHETQGPIGDTRNTQVIVLNPREAADIAAFILANKEGK